MKNKKFLLGILILTLVFGMTVIGCNEEETPEQDTYIPPVSGPGDTASSPISRVESIALGDMTSSTSGWQTLLTSINSTRKYINLDLSACTMTGTSFNPVPSVTTGKDYIISIILPTVATSIQTNAFKSFLNLKSISGANITTIGDTAFPNCPYLQSASFPLVTTIGQETFSNCSSLENINFPLLTSIGSKAFWGCSKLQSANLPLITTIGENTFGYCKALTTLNVPKVTSIGSSAFSYTDNTAILTITMGATAPSTLGSVIFSNVNTTKLVKVKVPSGATGYTPYTGTSVPVSSGTDVNWANGFRGGGWNGSTLTMDFNINQSISLTIGQ